MSPMSEANTPPTPGNYTQPRPVSSASGSWTTYEPSASNAGFYTAYSRTTYRPTAEQLARDEERRRYLKRNVYLPIIIGAIIVAALFVLLVLLAFGVVNMPQSMAFIAGLSALTVILISFPLIFLMSILPIAWLAFTLNRRQQRKNNPQTGPMAYRGRIQTWLWQLDSYLNTAHHGVEGIGARLRKPLVALHARSAYWQGILRGIRDRFTRSI